MTVHFSQPRLHARVASSAAPKSTADIALDVVARSRSQVDVGIPVPAGFTYNYRPHPALEIISPVGVLGWGNDGDDCAAFFLADRSRDKVQLA